MTSYKKHTFSSKEHGVLRDKSKCVRVGGKGSYDGHHTRKFTTLEIERLQTLPDNYTNVEGISDSQRWRMIGNAWTVDVVAHIFKFIK